MKDKEGVKNKGVNGGIGLRGGGGGGGGLERDSKLLGSSAKLVYIANALRNLSCKQSQKFAAVISRLISE